MVRIRRSHRRGRGSIPRLGTCFSIFLARNQICVCSLFKAIVLTIRGLSLDTMRVAGYRKTYKRQSLDLSGNFRVWIRTPFYEIIFFLPLSIAARLAQSVEHGTLRR